MALRSRWWPNLTAAAGWLTRPHPRITDAESQRNARLLSTLLLTTALLVTGAVILVVTYDPNDLLDIRTLVAFSSIVAALAIYAVNRMGYVQQATVAFIAFLTLILVVSPYAGNYAEFTPFVVAPMLLAGMFYPFKWTAALIVTIVVVTFALNALFIDEEIWDRRIIWYFLLFAGGLVLVFKYHLNALEKLRQNRLNEINSQREQQRLQLIMEKERSEAFRTLTGNIAHDIKTPLAIISTSVYLAEKHTDPVVRQEKLNSINGQVHRLESFIQDLFEVARLDSEEPDLRLTAVDVNELVTDIEEEHRDIVKRKSLTLALDLDEKIPSLLANQADLHRALTNLVENAINYTPEGCSVTVRTRQQGRGVAVEVADTGIGIGEAELPHIFDRFYRTTQARRMISSGSGLGLAIVKRVVEMHEGTVEVESALGKGTTFRILLPVRD